MRNSADTLDGPPEKISKKGDHEELDFGDTKTVNCIQPPVVPCVYIDPETKKEKCLVVLMLCSGVKGLTVDVVMKGSECPQTLIVKYNWPATMCDMASLFRRDRDGTMIAHDGDPMVQAVEKALRQFRENVEDSPVATIEVKLPVEVKQDPENWTKTFQKKDDGGLIVFLEFECIRNEYGIVKKEKFLQIE